MRKTTQQKANGGATKSTSAGQLSGWLSLQAACLPALQER
jgi:hypothetical protein